MPSLTEPALTETVNAMKRACGLLRVVNQKIGGDRSGDFKEVLEGVLGAIATALIPLTKGHASISDEDVRTELDNLLALFKTFVASSSYRHAINHLHLLRPLDTAKMLAVDAAAIKSIARNLYRLADKGHIAQSEECPSRSIIMHMKEACESHRHVYEGALIHLQKFADRWPAPNPHSLSQAAALSAHAVARMGLATAALAAPPRDSAFSEKAEEVA